jgi:pimeloyl-ACP methyl ester carboxylesterase
MNIDRNIFAKKLKWKTSRFALLIAWVMVTSISACQKKDIDADALAEFEDSSTMPNLKYTDNGDLSIRYLEVTTASAAKPTVIFVHGAPGGSDNYYDYLKDPSFTDSFNLVTIDRLGYGGSGRGDAEPSIQKQAESLYPIINELLLDSQPIILVGHSYGGPIIAKIAMDRPDDIHGLLFLAPAIDPKHEKFEWAGKLGCSVPTKWITPKDMETAAVEKTNHAAELEKLLDQWKNIQSKVTYVHGDSDGIVPFENFAFAEEKLAHVNPNMVRMHGGSHFIPFQEQEKVKKWLLNLSK